MKKLAAILACILAVAAISGCNGKPEETQASSTEPTPAVTDAPVSSDATTTPGETTDTTEEKNSDSYLIYAKLEMVKDKAPHLYGLYEYFSAEKATIKLNNLDDSFNVTANQTLYIDDGYGLRLDLVETADPEDPVGLMLRKAHYLLISHKEKKVFDAEPGFNGLVAMDDELRTKTLGFDFDIFKVEVTTGEEEIGGVMYDFEKVTDGEKTTVYYADKSTGDIKYMKTDTKWVEVVECTFDCPGDAFDVPEDYEIIKTTESSGAE